MLMLGTILSVSDVGANDAMSALVAYLLVYLFMNLGAFGTCALVGWQTGNDQLSSFSGLGRRAPWLAFPMTVCLFSLVGMPPLGGFLAKWWLLVALGRSASLQPWLWGLVVIAAVNTLLSLFYYLRVIMQMYLKDDGQAAWHVPRSGLLIVNACSILLLLMGTILANPLKQRSDNYASGMFNGRQVAAQAEPERSMNAPLVSAVEVAP
jgi:NADH-quinone oxidoreductase subunit N